MAQGNCKSKRWSQLKLLKQNRGKGNIEITEIYVNMYCAVVYIRGLHSMCLFHILCKNVDSMKREKKQQKSKCKRKVKVFTKVFI